jgi:hypothetical protein
LLAAALPDSRFEHPVGSGAIAQDVRIGQAEIVSKQLVKPESTIGIQTVALTGKTGVA